MGLPKDLNQPDIYVNALVQAALLDNVQDLAVWLADDKTVAISPFYKWYYYFAERLLAIVPKPEYGFAVRKHRDVPPPKIGRNDHCPCGSGKKFKQCHLDEEESVAWKIGSPTPIVRAQATTQIIHSLGLDSLDEVPLEKCSPLVLAEMAAAYQLEDEYDTALMLLKRMLDGDRDDPFMLIDYWIARYAEWLVDAGLVEEGERFLQDEYKAQRGIAGWQVAQKLAAFYLDQGNTESAITWVETALAGNNENPFNHYLRGLLYHGDEQWEEAVASYEQAESLSGQFREEEKIFMSQLVAKSLEQARARQPLDDDDEEEEEEAEDALSDDAEQGIH